MKEDFFKFPSTPHLALLGDVQIRADKVMSESERNDFLRHELVVEEKVDGANLGISFDGEGNILAQNRGSYLHLPCTGQWERLSEWLTPRIDTFFERLEDRFILFGEWCYARHSVFYDRLPDWFLGYDIYDKQSAQFFSCRKRDDVFRTLGIFRVPGIGTGHFSLSVLQRLLSLSRIGREPAEGLYLRVDQGDRLVQRAKLVRPTFVQPIESHWSRGGIRANRLNPDSRD